MSAKQNARRTGTRRRRSTSERNAETYPTRNPTPLETLWGTIATGGLTVTPPVLVNPSTGETYRPPSGASERGAREMYLRAYRWTHPCVDASADSPCDGQMHFDHLDPEAKRRQVRAYDDRHRAVSVSWNTPRFLGELQPHIGVPRCARHHGQRTARQRAERLLDTGRDGSDHDGFGPSTDDVDARAGAVKTMSKRDTPKEDQQ